MYSIRIAAAAGLFLLASNSLLAQTTPSPTRPAAPQVVASADLKELVFDWEPVPGAYAYWLLERLHDPSRRTYYQAIQERIPGSRTRASLPVAAHQYDWRGTRYIVEACNTAGCTRSAEISPTGLKLDAIGYLKASNTGSGDRFGNKVALSADGTTLVVSAPGEDSSATGVNGNQADNSSENSGAVYVFRRTGRRWAQEAYLKAGVNQPGQSFGAPATLDTQTLALSGDGAWLAVGTPAQGTTLASAGAVYLFHRGTSGWTLATTLQAPTQVANDQFGFSVDMSFDGRRLKVSSLGPTDAAGDPIGRTHIHERPGDTWQRATTLAPYYTGDQCPNSRMSSSGSTLVTVCRTPWGGRRLITQHYTSGAWVHVAQFSPRGYKVGQPLLVNRHGTRMIVWEGISNGYTRLGRYKWESGTWVLDATQLGSNDASWPSSLAFDNQGDNFAYGDVWGSAVGEGVIDQLMGGGATHGIVHTHRFIEASIPDWQPRYYVKAANPDHMDRFSSDVAYSGDGWILAVGADSEDSAARGIDGDRTNNSAVDSGAVYLY